MSWSRVTSSWRKGAQCQVIAVDMWQIRVQRCVMLNMKAIASHRMHCDRKVRAHLKQRNVQVQCQVLANMNRTSRMCRDRTSLLRAASAAITARLMRIGWASFVQATAKHLQEQRRISVGQMRWVQAHIGTRLCRWRAEALQCETARNGIAHGGLQWEARVLIQATTLTPTPAPTQGAILNLAGLLNQAITLTNPDTRVLNQAISLLQYTADTRRGASWPSVCYHVHDDWVKDLVLCGGHVITASDDSTMKMLHVPSANVVRSFEGHRRCDSALHVHAGPVWKWISD